MVFGFLLVRAVLLLGSISYLVLLLGVARRRLGWQRRVIALVLSPIIGVWIWLSGALSSGDVDLWSGLSHSLRLGCAVPIASSQHQRRPVMSETGYREDLSPDCLFLFRPAGDRRPIRDGETRMNRVE